MERLIQLHDLIVRTLGDKSTKYRSYVDMACPAKPDSLKVGRELIYEINGFYNENDFLKWSSNKIENPDFNIETEVSEYFSLLKDATFTDNIDPTLDSNFLVDLNKTAEDQKKEIKHLYSPQSVPRIALNMVEHIERSHRLPTHEAAKVVVNLLAKLYPWMQMTAMSFKADGILIQDLNRLIFEEIFNNLDNILPATTLPAKYRVDESSENKSLIITSQDYDGLVRVSRLQERVFDRHDQLLTQDLLEHNQYLKPSLIVLHKLLVDFGVYRLSTIPGRSEHTLMPYEEIFITQKDKLIPNVRFMKILTTNWIPAIARVLRENKISDPSKLEAPHISEGIQNAEHVHKLFQMSLFMFNRNLEEPDVIYGGHIPKVCPAKKIISTIGGELLPVIYDRIKERDSI